MQCTNECELKNIFNRSIHLVCIEVYFVYLQFYFAYSQNEIKKYASIDGITFFILQLHIRYYHMRMPVLIFVFRNEKKNSNNFMMIDFDRAIYFITSMNRQNVFITAIQLHAHCFSSFTKVLFSLAINKSFTFHRIFSVNFSVASVLVWLKTNCFNKK